MKVLIVAAGEGVRWENYRNVPKHIVEVEGEVLLNRTYAQFKRYTDNIVIVSTDPRYAIGQTYAPLVSTFIRGVLNVSSNQPSSQTPKPFYQTIIFWIIPNISPFVKS
jgi:choline kinase